ncbi:HAMP domain-containing sensor histidine kinase [Microbacterium deminutum]|uniref:histidine kinase n=1 Tax=Microbacterium deminutum TaxID=344164 RepID=A0ABP5CAR5_9MICO
MTSSRSSPSVVVSDRMRVQRSALRVALSVALASVAIVVLITVIAVAVIFTGSRPDDRPGHHGALWSDRVVDLGDVVPLIIVLGTVGLVALSLVAWYVARRSALPLAEALRVQRAFVADASHELRTPLTTLTSRIQLARHRAERGGDVLAALGDLRRDAAVMDDVLTDLLLAADTAGTRAEDSEAVAAVASVVAASADALQFRAADAGVAIVTDAPRNVDAAAEPTALGRALVALLDNAVRHSPPGGAVTVSGRATARMVELRVTDEGTGITGVDPDRLFERFVRSETEAPRRGFGLGLALVRDIAARFGGHVSVERTSPQGTTFLLVLPVARHPNPTARPASSAVL